MVSLHRSTGRCLCNEVGVVILHGSVEVAGSERKEEENTKVNKTHQCRNEVDKTLLCFYLALIYAVSHRFLPI